MDEIELQNISRLVAGDCADVFTIPKDKLLNLRVNNKPTIVNCNTGNSGTDGEHWVFFSIQNIKGTLKADYMDSYGKDCEFYNIAFPYKIINSNNRQFQQFNSDQCGQYCLAFTYYRLHNIPFKKICSFFSTDYYDNDAKVNNLYKKLSSRVPESKAKSCSLQRCKTLNVVLKKYQHDALSTY